MKTYDVVKRKVKLEGWTNIAFDRSPGNTKEVLEPAQKLYLDQKHNVIMPAQNIHSFLCSKEKSATSVIKSDKQINKRLIYMRGALSIEPPEIPITRNGKPIRFEGFEDGNIQLYQTVAKPNKTAPTMLKTVPIVCLPWELEFGLSFMLNEFISEDLLRHIFERGGTLIGLGTFRGMFGKFIVTRWE